MFFSFAWLQVYERIRTRYGSSHNRCREGPMPHTSSPITKSYLGLRLINLGQTRVTEGDLAVGDLTIILADELVGEGEPFSIDGKLHKTGVVSGMSKLHARLSLGIGDKLKYEIQSVDGTKHVAITQVEKQPAGQGAQAEPAPQDENAAPESVFKRLALNHVHLEAFRPTNLDHWQPRAEPDVYMAFGVLQEFTDYRYCCGVNKELLDQLGAEYETKPDAVLIDRKDDQYRMAEWKVRSSDFIGNHQPEDVDVLICWEHNETDKTKLPPDVVALKDIAKLAAQEALNTDDD